MKLPDSTPIRVLRYLWSIPAVRYATGWIISKAIEITIERIRKKEAKHP